MLQPQWQNLLAQQAEQPYFKQLMATIAEKEAQGIQVFPPKNERFNAFNYCDMTDIKVVILGQDPYHGEGQAHGLAFSVNKGVKIPPSLANIYKELKTDIPDFTMPEHGCLVDWAQQGVLLLNNVLTVEQARPNSHAKLGWEKFTDAIVSAINEQNSGCVFLLWGAFAQKKGRNINTQKHAVLAGPHPSPLSAYRGFFGCHHFSLANDWLIKHNKTKVSWQLS